MRRPDRKSDALMISAAKLGLRTVPVEVKGRIDPKAIRKIRNFIISNDISLIHTHDFKSDFYGLLATSHLGVKRIATAHGSTRDSLLKKLYLYFDERAAYRTYDRIIAVSEDLRKDLLSKGTEPQKIEVIQNGLDIGVMNLNRDATGSPLPFTKNPNSRVFAVVGRLYPDKGHSLFLQAFADHAHSFPQSIGIIVGDGPEKENILQQISSLHLGGKVFFCGVILDIKQIYEAIDCLIIPSFTEGLPYVMLEAMAFGIPVIATAVGDIPLLIQNGKTGYLISPGDAGMLCKRMSDVLSMPAHALAMADQGKRFVRERFSADRMTKQTEALYLSLLS